MDQGIFVLGAKNHHAVQIENCDCQNMYNGTSCQDPGNGYYRYRPFPPDDINQYESFIGFSKVCGCSNRSEKCDKETGFCIDCHENTGGEHCNECAEGFYGNPKFGQCTACPCPETRKNFAKGCLISDNKLSCLCKMGYTGTKCEKCSDGYFGRPELENGKCESCQCDIDGSLSKSCDKVSGLCQCLKGISGAKCNRCDTPKHIPSDGQCKLCDECSLLLLERLDIIEMESNDSITFIDSMEILAPWNSLNEYNESLINLKSILRTKKLLHDQILLWNDTSFDKLESKVENLKKKIKVNTNRVEKRKFDVIKSVSDAKIIDIDTLEQITTINKMINQLNEYGFHVSHINMQNALLDAKKFIHEINSRKNILKTHNKSHENVQMCLKNIGVNIGMHDQNSTIVTENLDNELDQFILLKEKIQEINKFVNLTEMYNDQTNEINKNNGEQIIHLKNKLTRLNQLENVILQKLNNSFYSQSVEHLNTIGNNFKEVHNTAQDIVAVNKSLSVKIQNYGNDLQALLPKIEDAEDFSDDITDKFLLYNTQFQNTQVGTIEAIQAVNAYTNIRDFILHAEKTTHDAFILAKKTFLKLNPINDDSFQIKSEISLSKSKIIMQVIKDENTSLQGKHF